MARRDNEDAGDGLADWLAGLSEPPADEQAAADAPIVPPPADEVLNAPAGAPGEPAGAAAPPELAAGDATAGHSSRRLWLLAAIPWILVAAGALAALWDGGATDQPGRTGDRPSASATADAEAASPAEPSDAGASAAGAPAEDAAAASAAGDPADGGDVPADLAATAETAVRTVGARQLGDGADGAVHIGYARATEASALGDAAVVTVAALARHAADGRWGEPKPVRFAVVVDEDGRLREPPWPLPGGGLTTESPQPAELDPVDVTAAEELVDGATGALAQAGYDAPDVQALHRVGDDRALRVEAVARPPGAQQRGAVVAWLTPDGARVLGHRPTAGSGGPSPDEPEG